MKTLVVTETLHYEFTVPDDLSHEDAERWFCNEARPNPCLPPNQTFFAVEDRDFSFLPQKKVAA